MKGASEKAEELAKRDFLIVFLTGQFVNLPILDEKSRGTTGPEIIAIQDGKVDIFVAGVGTGGTVTGVGEYLKSQNSNIGHCS